MTYHLIDGIDDTLVTDAVEEMKLAQARVNAEMDQIHAQLQSSPANEYTTRYIRVAAVGLVLAMNADASHPAPLSVHTIQVHGGRHVIPHGAPETLVTAWESVLKPVETPSQFAGVTTSGWEIQQIPLYHPTNTFHARINEFLVLGEQRFQEATKEIEELFSRRDRLARQYNAAAIGIDAITHNDDGTSETHGF